MLLITRVFVTTHTSFFLRPETRSCSIAFELCSQDIGISTTDSLQGFTLPLGNATIYCSQIILGFKKDLNGYEKSSFKNPHLAL